MINRRKLKFIMLISLSIIVLTSLPIIAQSEEGTTPTPDFQFMMIRVVLLVAFSIAALFIMFKRPSWRNILLLLSVMILGFYLEHFLHPLSAVQIMFIKYDTPFLLILSIPVLMALFIGRVFCGYICPAGAIQELLFIPKLETKLSKKSITILRKVKYIFLSYLVIRVLITQTEILTSYTPFRPLFSLGGAPLTITLTIVTAIISLLIYRPFCQFFCPFGALLGLVSLGNDFKLVTEECSKCNACCPVDAIENGKVNKTECICCGECGENCPV